MKMANEHAVRCIADIEFCTDRQAHIRATARANEATAILSELHLYILDSAVTAQSN